MCCRGSSHCAAASSSLTRHLLLQTPIAGTGGRRHRGGRLWNICCLKAMSYEWESRNMKSSEEYSMAFKWLTWVNSWFRWWSGLLALFSGSIRGFLHVPLQHLPYTSRSALAQGSWRENVTLTSHQQSASIMLAWLCTIWAGSDHNERWKGETGLVYTWTNKLKQSYLTWIYSTETWIFAKSQWHSSAEQY